MLVPVSLLRAYLPAFSATTAISLACVLCTGCGDVPRVEADQSEVVVIEGANPDPSTRDDCALGTDTPDSSGQVDQLLSEREQGCTVVARRTLELKGDIDAVHPDPGVGMIARDRAGRFYTGCCWVAGEGQVLVWDQNGDFLRSQGQLGEGPGEFPRGWLAFFSGADDSLYVFDTNARMTVFDPSGALSRTVSSPPVSPMSQFATRFTDDGTFVSVGPVWGGASEHRFHVTDVNGTLVRSFGEPTELDIMNAAVGYGSGGTFWALGELGGGASLRVGGMGSGRAVGPPVGAGSGMVAVAARFGRHSGSAAHPSGWQRAHLADLHGQGVLQRHGASRSLRSDLPGYADGDRQRGLA